LLRSCAFNLKIPVWERFFVIFPHFLHSIIIHHSLILNFLASHYRSILGNSSVFIYLKLNIFNSSNLMSRLTLMNIMARPLNHFYIAHSSTKWTIKQTKFYLYRQSKFLLLLLSKLKLIFNFFLI
jgi:hypothetical protein